MSQYAYIKASKESGYKYVSRVGQSTLGLARTIGGWNAETIGTTFAKGYGLTRELAIQDALANVGKQQRRSNGLFGHVWHSMHPSQY